MPIQHVGVVGVDVDVGGELSFEFCGIGFPCDDLGVGASEVAFNECVTGVW